MPKLYQPKWSTLPLGAAGEKLEFVRDFVCFHEGRSGERITYKVVEFSQEVKFAEVFLSGFNMWYTREEHDHEVMQLRVDAWVDNIGTPVNPEFLTKEEIENKKKQVSVKLMYMMTDEDTTDDDDYNDACIGFTVVALTKPPQN